LQDGIPASAGMTVAPKAFFDMHQFNPCNHAVCYCSRFRRHARAGGHPTDVMKVNNGIPV